MEYFLDRAWEYIYAAILTTAAAVDSLLSPLQPLIGPAGIIVLLALATVFTTKFLSRKCRTKRHIELEKQFYYWLSVREEAVRCEDREKGSRMAKNIDKAKLNKCYYDYFLEGLLLSLATMYIPILMVMSYINASYRPDTLIALTGKPYIAQIGTANGEPLIIGSIFFYIVSLLFIYATWFLVVKYATKYQRKRIITTLNEQQGASSGYA